MTTLDRWIPPAAAKVLARTPESQWRFYSLVFDAETGSRLMLRSELVAMLRGDDLEELAREAETRRVPRGSILVLGISNTDGPILRVLRGR